MKRNGQGCLIFGAVALSLVFLCPPDLARAQATDELEPSVMEPVESAPVIFEHMASDPPPLLDEDAANAPLLPEPQEEPAAEEPPTDFQYTESEAETETEGVTETEPEPESEPEFQLPSEPPALPVAHEKTYERPSDLRSREEILESPTQSVEAYEKARKEHMYRESMPDWGFSLGIAPRAFRNADLRVPIDAAPGEGKPRITGIKIGGERVLYRDFGMLAGGADFNMYGNTHRNQFSGLLAAMLSLGPYLHYQAHFTPRQLVVPSIKGQYELLRYSYAYAGNKVRGFRALPRMDLGLMVYLNWLDRGSAGQMKLNWDVKRTYLYGYYSIASDPSKKDFDLSESGAIRVGFRFEM